MHKRKQLNKIATYNTHTLTFEDSFHDGAEGMRKEVNHKTSYEINSNNETHL